MPSSPTRVRYSVLFLLCLLAMLTYMDRAANGSAKKAIMDEFGGAYSEDDFFWVLMAFQFAYAIFEVPSGWLGDTVGPRSTLLRIVLWWSAFVALTAFTGMSIPILGITIGFTGLIILQFCFGVGEAGAFPNMSKALYNWFPASQRGFAKSAIWMSARLMGGLTPLIWVSLTDLGGLSWREAMWLFAALAAIWCVVFALFFTNLPREHSWVNDGERELIDLDRKPVSHANVPWRAIFRSRNLWALCLMYAVTNFCWYFLMYNLPRTMQIEFADWKTTTRGKLLLALLSGSPLLVGMFGCLLGGILSDRYIRRTGDRTWGRRRYGMIGYAGAGLAYLAAACLNYYQPGNLWGFATCLILMGFLNDLMMAPAWACCQDIGQRYAATVAGTMNMFGNLAGAVTTIFITGLLMKHYPENGIFICFTMYAIVYCFGILMWLFVDASKPIVPS